MGDIMEVTLGDSEIEANGAQVGYVTDVNIETLIEYAEFTSRIPKVRIGKAKTKLNISVGFSAKEMRPENILLALGIAQAALTNVEAVSPVTSKYAADSWAANTSYILDDVIEPTTINGKGQICTTAGDSGGTEPAAWSSTIGGTTDDDEGLTAWQATTAYTTERVEPTTANGYVYVCTTPGTSGGSEPTWGTTPGGTTSDGTAEWTCAKLAQWTCFQIAEEVTTALWREGDLYYAQVENMNLTDAVNVPLVYDNTYTTLYVNETDYIYSPLMGLFIIMPDGSMTDDAISDIAIYYEYTPVNFMRLNLKPESFVLFPVDVYVNHRKPTDGKHIIFQAFKCLGNTTTIPFNPVDWSAMSIMLSIINDEDRPNVPYGRLFFLDN